MQKLERNPATILLIDILSSDDRIWNGLQAHGFWEARELAMQVYLLLDRALMSEKEILEVNFFQVADHVNGVAGDAGHIETRFLDAPKPAQLGQLSHSEARQYNTQTGRRKMQLHSTIKGEDGRRFCETTLKLDPAEYDICSVKPG